MVRKKNVFIVILGMIGCVIVPEYDVLAFGASKLTEFKYIFYPLGSHIATQSTDILIELVNETFIKNPLLVILIGLNSNEIFYSGRRFITVIDSRICGTQF